MSDDLVRAITRQIAHLRAKTDGESPYYAGNEWAADLWRADTEIIVRDYLERHCEQWHVVETLTPPPTHRTGDRHPVHSEG